MTDLSVWPPTMPPELVSLPEHVAHILDLSARSVASTSELADASGPALVVLTGADAPLLAELDSIIAGRPAPTALVIGDGWIGTEGPDVAAAMVGAGAVALTRAIAVRRHLTGRVNVVCVPERLIGDAGSQHGPLAIDIGSIDVAEVVAFVLSAQSSYIDGQVLYANGGRQLFSSLTA
jgi:hypothetical protein